LHHVFDSGLWSN